MFNRKEKILLAILAIIQFSHIVDFMIMMPLGPQIMRLFSIPPQKFGFLVSSYNFAAGLSGLLASFFIDKYDRKKALLFVYVGFALATLSCALSKEYSSLLFSRALTGVFGGVLNSLILSVLSDSFESSRRGSAMGILMTSFSFASIMGVPMSLFLANHFSWHAPFVFLGLISLLIIFVAGFTLPSMNQHLKGPHQHQNPLLNVIGIAANPNQVLALTFLFILILGQFTVIPFLSSTFVANAGLQEAQLPLIYLVGGCFTIFSSPMIGRLSDKIGKRKIFLITSTISIPVILFMTQLGQTPLWIILAGAALFFVCTGGRMIPAMALITTTSTPQKRGSFMSITSSVQQVASAFSSFLAGLIIIQSPEGMILHYNYVGYLAALCTVIAMFLILRIKSVEDKEAL